MLRSILHCDMNNFYASVECMLDPALKKYPIAVCGSVEERHGIVLAKNYKAKAFDVKTGDAVWQAKQKCKDLVVVPPHYEEYIKYSKLARSVYERYTDQVEPYGMDECWLDISGTESLFGSPEKVANEIRETMKFELGLTISVGVSFNKIFAKLGSDILLPENLIKQGMYLFSLGEKIECLNKIYFPGVYKRFDALADFLGCSKKALAIRMKQLGLLKKEYLDNPFDLVTVYPEVSEL